MTFRKFETREDAVAAFKKSVELKKQILEIAKQGDVSEDEAAKQGVRYLKFV